MVPTANDHSRMVAWVVYDRLVSHGEKTLPDGTVSYDAKVIKPEKDVKWSFDRAIVAGGGATGGADGGGAGIRAKNGSDDVGFRDRADADCAHPEPDCL